MFIDRRGMRQWMRGLFSVPMDQGAAVLGVVETEEEVCDRRLPHPTRPHQGHRLTGRNGKRDIVQDALAVPVIKRNILEDDFTLQARRVHRLSAVLNVWFYLQDLSNPLSADHRR